VSDWFGPDDGAVIVVHYGDPALTQRCLDSLGAMDARPAEVVLVNNAAEPWTGGKPGTVPLRVVETSRNVGFAGGVNLGIDAAQARGAAWYWLVNNDAHVRSDALSTLLEALNTHHWADLVGSYVVQSDGRIWFGGGGFDALTGRAWHLHYGAPLPTAPEGPPTTTDWVTGCSLLMKAKAVDERGTFDEDLFLYREELDWQLRHRRPDQAVLVREPLVIHDAGQSSGGGRSRVETTFLARNQVILARRHAGWRRPVWVLTVVAESVVGPVLKGHGRRARWAWQGLRASRRDPETVLRQARGGPTAPAG
jgi:GT2 family glycosyltransferase